MIAKAMVGCNFLSGYSDTPGFNRNHGIWKFPPIFLILTVHELLSSKYKIARCILSSYALRTGT